MTITKPQVKIVNCETGEEIIRDANAEEIADLKLNADNASAAQAQSQAKVNAKAALLSKLGITAEEAALLLS
jgi:hypothetical protein